MFLLIFYKYRLILTNIWYTMSWINLPQIDINEFYLSRIVSIHYLVKLKMYYFCENSNGTEIMKSLCIYTKRCNYNKHFTVIADCKVCKHYFNNLTILLFYYHLKAEAEHSLRGHVSVASPEDSTLNSCIAQTLLFLADKSHFFKSSKCY